MVHVVYESKTSQALEYVRSFGGSKISNISKVLEYQTIPLGLLKSLNVLYSSRISMVHVES